MIANAAKNIFNNISLGDVCFISDLHLSDKTPQTLAKFEWFCAEVATQFNSLIILGDLFEYWLGDDTCDDNPTALRVIAALKKLRAKNIKIGCVVGNRDFLIGEHFAQRAGMTLLPDPCVIHIHGQKVLLTHGDLLCSDDNGYQRFRRITRMAWVQNVFLKTPKSWRSALAEHLRARSEGRWQNADDSTRQQLRQIQDTNADTVKAWFNEAQTQLMIHGHTHYASTHLTHSSTRLVLPDWHCEDQKATRWGYVAWSKSNAKPQLHYFQD